VFCVLVCLCVSAVHAGNASAFDAQQPVALYRAIDDNMVTVYLSVTGVADQPRSRFDVRFVDRDQPDLGGCDLFENSCGLAIIDFSTERRTSQTYPTEYTGPITLSLPRRVVARDVYIFAVWRACSFGFVPECERGTSSALVIRVPALSLPTVPEPVPPPSDLGASKIPDDVKRSYNQASAIFNGVAAAAAGVAATAAFVAATTAPAPVVDAVTVPTSLVVALGAGLVSAGGWAIGAALSYWAADPPDPEYTVLAQPAALRVRHVHWGGRGGRRLSQTYNALADNSARIASLGSVGLHDIERAQGAHIALATEWERRQALAAAATDAQLALLLRRQLGLIREAHTRFKRILRGARPVSAAKFKAFQRAVAAHGLPIRLARELTALGLTSADQLRVRQAITTMQPSVPLDLTAILASKTLSDALRHSADMLEQEAARLRAAYP
jgi:hypothetical protein